MLSVAAAGPQQDGAQMLLRLPEALDDASCRRLADGNAEIVRHVRRVGLERVLDASKEGYLPKDRFRQATGSPAFDGNQAEAPRKALTVKREEAVQQQRHGFGFCQPIVVGVGRWPPHRPGLFPRQVKSVEVVDVVPFIVVGVRRESRLFPEPGALQIRHQIQALQVKHHQIHPGVTAQVTVRRGRQTVRLGPPLDLQNERLGAGIDQTVLAQQFGIGHGDVVFEADVKVERAVDGVVRIARRRVGALDDRDAGAGDGDHVAEVWVVFVVALMLMLMTTTTAPVFPELLLMVLFNAANRLVDNLLDNVLVVLDGHAPRLVVLFGLVQFRHVQTQVDVGGLAETEIREAGTVNGQATARKALGEQLLEALVQVLDGLQVLLVLLQFAGTAIDNAAKLLIHGR